MSESSPASEPKTEFDPAEFRMTIGEHLEELRTRLIRALLGVVLVSLRFTRAPSLVAALLSVVAYDFFFIPPYYSFAVSDLRHLLTFGVMLVVATVISSLTRRVRVQADRLRRRALHDQPAGQQQVLLAGRR